MPFEELLGPFGFRFVASYNSYISTAGEMFSTSNALFCLPPAHVRSNKDSTKTSS